MNETTILPRTALEPGLLKVFRLAAIIELMLTGLTFCAESMDEAAQPGLLTVYALGHTALLAGYLSWRWLRRRLGHRYLPGALLIASTAPSLGIALDALDKFDRGLRGADVIADPSGLLIWLIVPLLLISSQYTLRTVFLFCLGTTLIDLTTAVTLRIIAGTSLEIIGEMIIIRNLLFWIVGYVVVRLSQASRDQWDALAEKNMQLAHYATTLEQLAVSRERNRMARELHDTLAHTLSAVSVQLGALEVLMGSDPDAAREQLNRAQDMTRSGMQEARRALQALRASPLQDLGLSLALRRLAESTAERAGLRLNLSLPDQLDSLRPEVEQHLYRIAEEALTNVVRHANARTLTLALTRHDPAVSLLIVDDGTGFDPVAAQSDGNFGLVGMRERALLCGGTLEIDSHPQQGTTLKARIEEAL